MRHRALLIAMFSFTGCAKSNLAASPADVGPAKADSQDPASHSPLFSCKIPASPKLIKAMAANIRNVLRSTVVRVLVV
jgi:hypothetical protein